MRVRMERYAASVVLGILLCAASPALGQEGRNRAEGRGFFMAGVQGMDIDDLNSRLQANGYGAFSESFASLGGGGYGIMGNFLFGGEGAGILTGSESASIGGDFFEASLSGGYGLFRVGYIAWRRGGFILYPTLGLGGGGLGLRISQEATLPFDQYLQNPRRETTLGTGFLLLDLGVGADHLIILERRGEDEGGFAFGVRAGYLFAPYRFDWGNALDGPDTAIQGPYFRLVIGGGGSSRR